MTWQEELRQLDSALAGGQLSATEYRKRRDEILAAASSAQPPSPLIGPPSGPQPVLTDQTDGVAATNGTEDADATQIVVAATASGGTAAVAATTESADADQTQIISEPDKTQTVDADQTQVVHTDAAEQTQTITTDTVPAAGQPVWTAHLPDPSAQTGAFPSQQAHPSLPAPVTPMDAQDLFAGNKPPAGPSAKPWLVVLAIVLVLAVGGGVWWFFFNDSNSGNSAGDDSDEPNPTQSEPPSEPVDISGITLPGEPVPDSGGMDIAAARDIPVIAEHEAELLESDAGVDQLTYSGSVEGKYRYLLYAYDSADAEAAKATTDKVAAIQDELGLESAPDVGSDLPESVRVTETSNEQAAVVRGLYTSGNTTIQLCVLQVPTGNAADLNEEFTAALSTVLEAAPAT